jgi:nitroreductase
MPPKKTKKKLIKVSLPADHPSLKDLLPIVLLKPEYDNGIPVMKALKKRRTIREISDRKLPLQTLSDLLWAAYGVNRKEGPFGIPGRTAASASNSQEIDIYVSLKEGIYLYDAIHHELFPVAAGDLRSLAIGPGQASSGKSAPVRIIYVVDLNKLYYTRGYQEPGLRDPEIQKSYYYVDTGLIAGNVYLYAASRGLATWFHNCNKSALMEKLKLRPSQRILFGQTVGYSL